MITYNVDYILTLFVVITLYCILFLSGPSFAFEYNLSGPSSELLLDFNNVDDNRLLFL